MSYNNEYILARIIEIQNLTLEHTAKGVSQRWVYKNVIRKKYFISERTYNRYLARNAKSELKELKN